MLCKLHISSPETPGINRVFAFMNSYNKMRKVSFASGAVVLVCWNGMFWSDEGTFARRHYRNVWDDIHSAVDTQVNKMHTDFTNLMEFKHMSEQQNITPKSVASLAGRMYFDGILSPRMLSDLKREMYNSEEWGFKKTDDGILLPDSLWKFYNNCTEAAKRAPAHETVGVHSKITKFLADAAGFEYELMDIRQIKAYREILEDVRALCNDILEAPLRVSIVCIVSNLHIPLRIWRLRKRFSFVPNSSSWSKLLKTWV